ncbi:MAG: hypothetical protein FWG64_08950 [Firmicutes bacterium]|nr:hypothetical protein [Bacillota bacterium]
MDAKYTDILTQKLQALTTIFDATKRIKFESTGSSEHMLQEIERFASLYEQRAEIIEKIKLLDEKLAKYKETPADSKLIAKIKETAKAIADLDKVNIKVSEEYKVFLKGGLKKVRDGRDISIAYSDGDSWANTAGHFFDKAN